MMFLEWFSCVRHDFICTGFTNLIAIKKLFVNDLSNMIQINICCKTYVSNVLCLERNILSFTNAHSHTHTHT